MAGMHRPKKMIRILSMFYLFLVPFCAVSAEGTCAPTETDPIYGEEQDNNDVMKNVMEDAIEKFTTHVEAARKTVSGVAEDDTERLNQIGEELDEITKQMKDQSNVYKFIEAKGIDRVILPYLEIHNTELRSQLLKLTQLLFDVAPTTTSVMIPIRILDHLLDIYEDDDLNLKARTMYILFAWLPDNPKVQARLMKIKGLEAFYQQIENLEPPVIELQLKLFSKIIKEHIKAKQDEVRRIVPKSSYYKSIGLIERLSTARICHGLFDIFQLMWENNDKNKGFMVPVFEILMDVQPYCTKTLYGRTETIDLLSELYKYIMGADESVKDYYKLLGVNITSLETALQKYVDELKVKDEL